MSASNSQRNSSTQQPPQPTEPPSPRTFASIAFVPQPGSSLSSGSALRQRQAKPAGRTTKTNQKLVVFPPGSSQPEQILNKNYNQNYTQNQLASPIPLDPNAQPWIPIDGNDPQQQQQQQTDASQQQQQQQAPIPLSIPVPAPPHVQYQTEAEQLAKDRRIDLPRVTCYCTADAYNLEAITAFLRERHGVNPALYDECLYVSYEHRGNGSLSSRVATLIGGGVTGLSNMTAITPTGFQSQTPGSFANFPVTHINDHHLPDDVNAPPAIPEDETILNQPSVSPLSGTNLSRNSNNSRSRGSIFEEGLAARGFIPPSSAANGLPVDIQPKWMGRNEVFLFDFGVIVLWNFSQEEELSYVSTLKAFATNPKAIEDCEIEDFHFQYNLGGSNQPRIFNDMITLKSGNPMIKLTISHGIAQSAKLALFENIMEQEIASTSTLPKMMAKYGEVKLHREDVIKIVGRLFRLRMNVNLISNVLDTPELFWSEPELEGLYNAIRGYLEISQRVKLLNNRTSVISDLLDMLTDHLHGTERTFVTMIVIVLIVVTCAVAGGEVYVKFLMVDAGMEG